MSGHETHPVADLFPMLADDELNELAADIAERGLLHPVVLDSDGLVLDGRNRLAACERAGIEPSFVTYDGEDAGGYALAVNLQRRNLNKGQQAGVLLRAGTYLEDKYGREDAEVHGITQQYISKARVVDRYLPALLDQVISGAKPLTEAYAEAQKRKQADDSDAARMVRLQEEAPDLAALVTEERLTLAEAITALNGRVMTRKREIEDAHNEAARIVATVQGSIASIITGLEHGETDLIDKDTVADLRRAIDLLEDRL